MARLPTLRWIAGRCAGALLLLFSVPLPAQPIFDVHLHYKAADAEHFTPAQIVAFLDAARISRAAVIGQPPALATRLHREAPERIVPFLSVYRSGADKGRLHRDAAVPARVEAQLASGHWRGLGELHLFAADRHSAVFQRLIELAGRHGLIMMIHGDPAVIDTLYEQAPGQPVIWAHAGAHPYPPLLDDYLARYPALYIDLSVRNDRIAPNGELADAWWQLFQRHPDRVLLGVDTFSTARWQKFGQLTATTRQWLDQLEPELAQKLAHGNASRLFARQQESGAGRGAR